ncbi:MAG: sugar isomerase (SIS) [Candidatus Dadabacteria bacterium CSP1-2]|jgi:D-sedoheptulose 7-phosphate isomerase|nr:MAG: sugar isomerase (SIS) [Candidatus Dadabacteria bacterium CSP1-2]OGE24909.1 MAG: phosphoheptose isomerase [Candidatus Dadabacteria bacterium RBG_19FT_COMBO_40_33]
MKEFIISRLRESADLKLVFAKQATKEVIKAVNIIEKSLKSSGKILIFGNGGSAADAQHIAAEFVNRYLKERNALPAIALTTDTSILTSIGNDSSFENIFSRQIEALGKKGDVAWGLSTSGRSKNIVKALSIAKSIGLKTIGFTGSDGGEIKKLVDCNINVPSMSTPRIQELHITIGHIICELIEDIFSNIKK